MNSASEMASDPTYVDMSLDDVIRDMKAKQACQEQESEGISPFFRKTPYAQYTRRRFPPTNQPKSFNNRSNYLNHLAKKRVQQARKTLDLRQRLITIRASKEGLDLRWKIVANMIFKLRQQAKSMDAKQRFHPYAMPSHSFRPIGCGQEVGFAPQHRVSKTALSQIERLVGRLPAWMKPNNLAPAMLPHPREIPVNPMQNHYHQNEPSGVGPIRTMPRPYYPHAHNYGVPTQQEFYPPVVHSHPYSPAVPRVENVYVPAGGTYGDMPPLAYAPPPPTRLSSPGYSTPHSTPTPGMNNMNSQPEHIEIVVANSGEEPLRVKKTLNERFTQ